MTKRGETFAWGANSYGQLGLGLKSRSEQPQRVEALSGQYVVQVVSGWAHSVALLANGEVLTWGSNSLSQLGHSFDTPESAVPQPVVGLRGRQIAQVVCGRDHSAALTEDGMLYTWGDGLFGKLGHGDSETQKSPTPVEALNNIAIVQVACGGDHTVALSSEGQLFTWGWSANGRLGHSATETEKPQLVDSLAELNIARTACGDSHTIAVTDTGEVYTWGRNTFGQLGHGTTSDVDTPKLVEALRGKFVMQISGGGFHTVAVIGASGEVYSWGRGKNGQLGHGDTFDQCEPVCIESLQGRQVERVTCGFWHTTALTASGTLLVWGYGGYGVCEGEAQGGASGDGMPASHFRSDSSASTASALSVIALNSVHRDPAQSISMDPRASMASTLSTLDRSQSTASALEAEFRPPAVSIAMSERPASPAQLSSAGLVAHRSSIPTGPALTPAQQAFLVCTLPDELQPAEVEALRGSHVHAVACGGTHVLAAVGT